MKTLILALLLMSLPSLGETLSQSFPAGSGANYKIKMQADPTPILLQLYVASTRVDSVNIEYFLETKGLVSVQMWQQFEIGVAPGKAAEIRKGYVLARELTKPESMPKAYLEGASGGIQVNDFLFADKARLDKDKVGIEMVEISAGATKATHYRAASNGQTVDYWISDEAKPMGLVMLVSKSEKDPNRNYSLELVNLMENVKAKIKPEESVPLTENGKGLLAKPASLR